ncbi:uncharacterized protein il17rb isoform X2 [Poecilia latipinna]|uniref:uncharacterized protein il17rb isoform X2 n=1 Tax=Poecilia latipinna TaxID=48699 RepID=UPI00072DA6FD|nr:PREDICTED: interleukin-17 receptor B isoform X2 [Poecilia latipinna]
MWQCILFCLCIIASRGTAHDIKVDCQEPNGPPITDLKGSPSKVADLTLELLTVGNERKLNVSWAINIDASNRYLKYTRIISGLTNHICIYNPPFTAANLTGLEKVWFSFLVDIVSHGSWRTIVYNEPLPPDGSSAALSLPMWVPALPTTVAPSSTKATLVAKSLQTTPNTEAQNEEVKNVSRIVFGVVASLIILISCFVIYKRFLSYSGFEILPMAAMTPVSVVVVYPPVTPAFQQAVVALAEFLQWHGGCRVAIDMWQQGKIAGLGPLRWLTEQVKSADHVLIVSPQVETPSSMSGPCTPASSLPRHSIPAATGDLYPLILNMVAGHARSATELAKFWVVQLHAEKDKNSCVLPPELQTCRAFCLMKDLNRLCKSLHSQRKVGKKISSLLFKHKILYSQNSTMKLREAIEMLGAKKPDVPE